MKPPFVQQSWVPSRGITKLQVLLLAIILAVVLIVLGRQLISAQIRSIISRERSDMHWMATGLEAYRADRNSYPGTRPLSSFSHDLVGLANAGGTSVTTFEPGVGPAPALAGLTTPVPYLPAIFPDAFARERNLPFGYFPRPDGWVITSAGPDAGIYDIDTERVGSAGILETIQMILPFTYDPTNGILSPGDVWRVKQ